MRRPSFPIFGTAYYPEHVPEAEWERDLRAMREAGLTCVRWGEFSWSLWEPREGVFDFSLSDRFVDCVERVGLELILCTPTATPPPWVIHGHPDWMMRDQFDRVHLGQRHYGCHEHPDYLAAVERMIAALGARYGTRRHLVGWQIDNEPNYGECFNGAVCDYHPRAIAAFRAWCRARYGTTAALNDAWQGHFWSRGISEWEQIDPPRPRCGHVNHGAWLAWCRFRAQSLAGFVHRQRDWLRRHSPGVSVGCNIPDVTPLMMVRLGQDYWAQAEGLDWAATDLYAFRKDPAWEQRYLAYETDLMRSALTAGGATFFVMETQAGPHNVPWRMDFVGGHFDPSYIDRCTQTYVRGGAMGVCFFLWRPWLTGVECGMNGINDADGSPTERTRALPGIIQRARTTLREADTRRRVVMHYSPDALAVAAHTDPDGTPDAAIPGWHALFAEAGCVVDVVDDRRLAERTWRSDDVLVLPYSLVLDEAEIAAIARCHAAGGRIVAGFASGFLDGEGRIHARRRRPAGLDRLLGLRQRAFDHLTAAHAWRLGAWAITGNVCLIERDGCAIETATDDGRAVLVSHHDRRHWFCAVDLGSAIWTRAPGHEATARLLIDAVLAR